MLLQGDVKEKPHDRNIFVWYFLTSFICVILARIKLEKTVAGERKFWNERKERRITMDAFVKGGTLAPKKALSKGAKGAVSTKSKSEKLQPWVEK